MIDYGSIILRIRDEKDLTQRELADLCHVTQAAIQKIESGKIKSINAEFMSELFYKLNVDPYVFLVHNYPYLFLEQTKNFRLEQKLRELMDILDEDTMKKEMKTGKIKSSKLKEVQAR